MEKLNIKEIQILELLYQRDYDDNFDLNLNLNSIELTETETAIRIKEAGYYLNKLKELGFLEIGYQPKAFITGGQDNSKYRNNIISIMWENIKLTYNGREYVIDNRKTGWDKFKLAVSNFVKDIGKELRGKIISHIVTFGLGFIAATIYILYIAN